jgi:Malectin domain
MMNCFGYGDSTRLEGVKVKAFRSQYDKVTSYHYQLFAIMVTMTIMLLHIFTGQVHAAQATLAWDPPVNTDGTLFTAFSGYKLYAGTASGSYDQTIDVGNATTFTLNTLTNGVTYYFVVTNYDGSGNESGYSNEVSKAFPFIYSLTANAGLGGTIVPLGSVTSSTATNGTFTITSVSVIQGATQSFSISPGSGNIITSVIVDGIPVGAVNSYTFANITANHTLSATFSSVPVTYTLSATAGVGGSITPSGSANVKSGASQSYVITPTIGYKIANVIVDSVSVGAVASYNFTNVTANHTIAASFAVQTYTVTATAGVGGSISPSGSASVKSGASQSYVITPTVGYKIANVIVDGVSAGAVAAYTFTNITANHTIAASFATQLPTYVTTINCGGSGYTAGNGLAYKADTLYSGGNPNIVTDTISGTTDMPLYQSWRYGTNFSYNIPLANGNYIVTFKFAENFASVVGQRVFNVTMQGIAAIRNLDIYAKVGIYKPYDLSIPISVSNGMLNLTFTGVTGNAIINAITVTR